MDISELAHEFNFVDTIKVERNENGQIDLKMPQHRYSKSDKTPVHQYGWGPFCTFHVDTAFYRETAGIYIFTRNHEIVYIGETVDIHNRIQNGYSNISPKNCFEGGQQTNCRINNGILKAVRDRGQAALWAMETTDRIQKEASLINECEPIWNLETPPSATAGQQQTSQKDESRSDPLHSRSEPPSGQHQSKGGKYAPLYDYLANTDARTLQLTFEEIENILDASLPSSARRYSVWWNPSGHSHAKGWANLGWTADPNLKERTVTFRKIQ
jgi:hypothetical protein